VYLGIALLLGLQAAFVYAPRLGRLFRTTPLDGVEVGLCVLAGLSIQPFISLEKWLMGRARERRRRAQPGHA
jgi:Ca2+-transporting ATPase